MNKLILLSICLLSAGAFSFAQEDIEKTKPEKVAPPKWAKTIEKAFSNASVEGLEQIHSSAEYVGFILKTMLDCKDVQQDKIIGYQSDNLDSIALKTALQIRMSSIELYINGLQSINKRGMFSSKVVLDSTVRIAERTHEFGNCLPQDMKFHEYHLFFSNEQGGVARIQVLALSGEKGNQLQRIQQVNYIHPSGSGYLSACDCFVQMQDNIKRYSTTESDLERASIEVEVLRLQELCKYWEELDEGELMKELESCPEYYDDQLEVEAVEEAPATMDQESIQMQQRMQEQINGSTRPEDNTTPLDKATTIAFDETSHDFGEMKNGESRSYTFTFTNTGVKPLVVEDAKGSCSCTVPSIPQAPIPPGGKGEIRVEFKPKPNQTGMIHQTATIITNTNPKVTKLYIKAEVLEE